MVPVAVRRSRLRLTCRLAALVLLVAALAGCTTGTDPGHGGSSPTQSSARDIGPPIPPSTLVATGSLTATTTAGTAPLTAPPAPDGVATAASAPGGDPKAIMGTTWLLVRAVVAGAIYDSPQPPGSSEYGSYTVQFVTDQLVANDGCNTIQIAATVDARTVTTFGDITSTGSACRDSALRIAYDRELLKASLGWQVSGARLTLTTRGGGDTYHFEPCRRRASKGSADDFACLSPSR